MTDITNIINFQNTNWKDGDYRLFLGQQPMLHDSLNVAFPELFNLGQKLKSVDWQHNELLLDIDRLHFEQVDKNTYEVMVKTIATQWSLDSIASRTILGVFAPFITSSELNQVFHLQSTNECLHALTYSEIVRQSLKKPEDVFNSILEIENMQTRGDAVAKVFSELKVLGGRYLIDPDSVPRNELIRGVFKGIIALYTLERISFQASFAASFAVGKLDIFPNVISYISMIARDEKIHYTIVENIIKELLKDPEWAEQFKVIQKDLSLIVDEVVDTEYNWSHYIFSEGRSIVGLNEALLVEFVEFNAQEVYDKLGLPLPFNRVEENPLPWFDDFVDLDKTQVAQQEVLGNNYKLNSTIDDSQSVVADLGFDLGVSRNDAVELPNNLNVFTKKNCPFCVKLKDFLNEQGVTYTEVDVEEIPSAKKELVSLGLTTVPQVFNDVTGDYIGDSTFITRVYG